jgi:hypothetical protein
MDSVKRFYIDVPQISENGQYISRHYVKHTHNTASTLAHTVLPTCTLTKKTVWNPRRIKQQYCKSLMNKTLTVLCLA